MKNYDVWFTLESPAVVVIEADSEEDAKEKAEEILANMNYDELIERISNAVDYMGVKVTEVTEC